MTRWLVCNEELASCPHPLTHKSIFRLETLLSAIFYQPERLELQQPSGNALGMNHQNIAV